MVLSFPFNCGIYVRLTGFGLSTRDGWNLPSQFSLAYPVRPLPRREGKRSLASWVELKRFTLHSRRLCFLLGLPRMQPHQLRPRMWLFAYPVYHEILHCPVRILTTPKTFFFWSVDVLRTANTIEEHFIRRESMCALLFGSDGAVIKHMLPLALLRSEKSCQLELKLSDSP